MKKIEQMSLALLAASLVLFALVAYAFATDQYGIRVPMYTPPAESNDFSFVTLVRDAKSLEGLKKICMRWAQSEDETREFIAGMHRQYTAMVREIAVTLAVAFAIFGSALLYIYLTARRLRRAGAS
jgi:hypothetical protein